MKNSMLRLTLLTAAMVSVAQADTLKPSKFYLGKETPPDGYVRVTPQTEFDTSSGYGWLGGQANMLAAELPEGNYLVTLTYEDLDAAAATTVKTESRQLMLMKQDRVGHRVRRFAVNLRRPEIDGGDRVRLNSREKNPLSARWDDRLTLEILPSPDGVETVTIEPAPKAITVYLAGDSTVADQRREPWGGWGQNLPRFFKPPIAVANHSESGRALFSFRWENRLKKILSTIQPGDYLFIQFGHNDQKNKREGAGPFTTYKQDLEDYVAQVREKQANPVLVTPMERRRWSSGKPGQTLTQFAEAVRLVGQEQEVPVIDLHAMSLKLYAALGEQGSKRAFVHYPANSFPGQNERLKDNTHHNTYGGYQLARCIVEGVRAELPELAKHLRDDAGTFDPSQPDDPDSLGIPPSPLADIKKPEGD